MNEARPPIGNQALSESLVFRPRWWWDPVPDWVLDQLDRPVLKELAVIQLEAHQAVLQAQLKAAEVAMGALRRGTK